MQLKLSEILPREFQMLYWTNCPARYRVIFGARNTGKSYDFEGTEVIDKIVRDPMRNVAIFRAVASDLKSTSFAEVKKALYRTGYFTKFQIKEHDVEIVYRATGQKIMFFGCDRGTAINGVTCAVGEITDFYFEEAYELKDYELFRQMDGSLRGDYCTRLSNGRQIPKQVTFLMNPWHAEGCWIYDKFVKDYMPDDNLTENILETVGFRQKIILDEVIEKGIGLAIHQSSYKINHWRAKNYDIIAQEAKKKTPKIYQVEFLGMWGVSGDLVYTEYNERLIITRDIARELSYRQVFIGIDTAYSNGEGRTLSGTALDNARVKHAYAVELCGITRKDEKGVEAGTLVAIDEYYYSQEIYGKKKSQPELIKDTIEKIIEWARKYSSNPNILKGEIIIYVDSGDQGSIGALDAACKEYGLSNDINSRVLITGSTKTIKINSRVRFMNQLMGFGRVRFSIDCKHLLREISHCKEGKGKPREDINDHAINAFEYGTIPMYPLTKDWSNFKIYR